ncbi:MAG: hypothetical protein LBJ12_01000 [Oscillospiraceae bacterium]|jgi:hypothetical protein|nr:hypothetical protein [Oscillospiraceae bacterium]
MAGKDLSFFMRKREERIVQAKAPKSITGKNGEAVMMDIRVLEQAEVQKINNAYRTTEIAIDERGNPYFNDGEILHTTTRDGAKAVRHMIAEALVYPNLKDSALMEFYECHDITDMPLKVFPDADDYAYVVRVVMAAINGDEKKLLEAAKN